MAAPFKTVVGGALKMRVEGMDCSACAIKVENALKRLPGVSDSNMNYSTETLSARLDENRTSREVVEGKIRALGYTPKSLSDSAAGEDEQAASDQPWWTTRKGRTILGLGGLLAFAFVISTTRPELSFWAYGAAALVGLVPVARRAFVGALSGTPFSIETLMTVAAAGAIAIGAAEEAAVVIFLFAIGELLETVAAGQARAGIKALINLVPRSARIGEAGGVGALLALAAGGMDLSVIGIIGIILLIGIVKKNGIMLVDFAIAAERDGMSPLEAIRTACLLRFRPILMTTAAAMLAGVPLALGTGPGSELRQPLGYAMVGGLALSQLLTLYTTPVVYLYLDRLRTRMRGGRQKSVPEHGEEKAIAAE